MSKLIDRVIRLQALQDGCGLLESRNADANSDTQELERMAEVSFYHTHCQKINPFSFKSLTLGPKTWAIKSIMLPGIAVEHMIEFYNFRTIPEQICSIWNDWGILKYSHLCLCSC